MRQIVKTSLPLIAVGILITSYAVADSNDLEHTLCISKINRSLTYGPGGYCPIDSDSILVGVPSEQELGDSSNSSFTMLLRDRSGELVDGVIEDDLVLRSGYIWQLDFATGSFLPSYDFSLYYLEKNCTGEIVAGISEDTRRGAVREFERMRKAIASGYLLGANTNDRILLDKNPYKLSPTAELIDNRSVSEDDELWYGITEKTLFQPSFGDSESCEEGLVQPFYITGLEQSNIVPPKSLPAPITWKKK